MRLPWKKRPAPPIVPTTVVARFVIPAAMLARDSFTVTDVPEHAVVTLNIGDDLGVGFLTQGDIIEVTAQMVSRKVTFRRILSTEVQP